MWRLIFVTMIFTSLPGSIIAAEPVFVDSKEAIVEQMLGSEKKRGLTRSFVVEEKRSITVRAKNQKGDEETMVVEVSQSALDQVARLKIEFDVNSANLRYSAYQLLSELGQALRDQRVTGSMICIKGHTDSDGEESYNLQLSYDRAWSVREYLRRDLGVAGEKLQVFGYGESFPLNTNSNSLEKQKNRRVEVALDCPELSLRY